jgi:hypothetical protein
MERLRGVHIAITRIVEYTAASVGGSPKCILIVQNMTETRSNLHQLLKAKQLCSALHEVYTEVLHNLQAVLKESTAKTTITASVDEIREQRSRNQKPTDDADKRTKNPTTSITGVNDQQF